MTRMTVPVVLRHVVTLREHHRRSERCPHPLDMVRGMTAAEPVQS